MKERHYTAAKLNAALRVLDRYQIQSDGVFERTDIDRTRLKDKEYRVSLRQIIDVLNNIAQQRWHPELPYDIGRNLHISDYGLYGYAVLSSTRYRDTVDFAQRFHYLAAPTAEMSFDFDKDNPGWEFEPVSVIEQSPDFYSFLTNLQAGIFASLHQDVIGQDFQCNLLELRYPRDSYYTIPAHAADVIKFSAEKNRYSVPPKWMDQRLELGNRMTFQQIVQICEKELSELLSRDEGRVSGKVRKALVQSLSFGANMELISRQIGLTSRTLRRHLKRENTTFSDIVDSTRSELALRYLRDTELSIQEIAYVLGFSDSASFVRAFRRWTGKTPKHYRVGF
ncbi:helix-turn-helix transcriptional regulator [Ruegeria lacuscaerulensis]|uniref:helix-turn-helix transcriptional regulator n=1 Tax=Ruegeria lacuscaerulensis TaxID=55218 RepID=UPI00147D4AFA|nr:AraC family transcriptional regulator [Ruegeria lacuscaerulensis]